MSRATPAQQPAQPPPERSRGWATPREAGASSAAWRVEPSRLVSPVCGICIDLFRVDGRVGLSFLLLSEMVTLPAPSRAMHLPFEEAKQDPTSFHHPVAWLSC
jgi:hypothetical protein